MCFECVLAMYLTFVFPYITMCFECVLAMCLTFVFPYITMCFECVLAMYLTFVFPYITLYSSVLNFKTYLSNDGVILKKKRCNWNFPLTWTDNHLHFVM